MWMEGPRLPNAILFDFNGVLVDDEPVHCQTLIRTLAEYDIPLDRETYYRDYLGFDDRGAFTFAFERAGRTADGTEVYDAIARKARHYETAIRAAMVLVPGAAEFVRAAAETGCRLAVVSGALRSEIELVLGEADLLPLFEGVVAAEDVSACKPSPEGYLRGLALLETPAERCIVLEDSLPGLAAARAAGLACVMLATSHPRTHLTGADLIWTDFTGHHPSELPWPARH